MTTLAAPPRLRKRQRLDKRLQALKTIRGSWDPMYQNISDHLLPWSGRFFVEDTNKGGGRHNLIFDGSATSALRVLGAGLMAGATSPARPWFRLTTGDPELNEFYSARIWLDEVARRMMRVFQKSNTYRVLHGMYEELGSFATSAAFVLPDYKNVIHLYPMTCGEYFLAQNYRGEVDTCIREFQRTVAEVITEFALPDGSNITQRTKDLYQSGELDQPVRMAHAVQPRHLRDYTKPTQENMPWSSCYWEVGVEAGKSEDGEDADLLRESGYKRFPVLAPRWATSGGDVYGNGPAFDAIGDIMQLQHEQVRKAEGIDYGIDPPLAVPVQLKNRGLNRLPGGVTYIDAGSNQQAIKPLWDVKLDLEELREDIMDVRDRIRRHFFADLFLMLTNVSDTTQRTAAEIAERHEEKLLMLGPVLERLHNELLAPLIDITFERMMEVGALPPPPPELHGMEINVEFVSVLAQAQRAIGVNSVDRFVANLMGISDRRPEILDRLNVDAWVDEYADMMGVSPKFLVPLEEAQTLRAARAKAKAAMDQAAMMQAQAKSARDLAAAPTDQPNALTAVNAMGMFSGLGDQSAAPDVPPGGRL